MQRFGSAVLLLFVVLGSACATGQQDPIDESSAPSAPAENVLASAPWRQPPLVSGDVPAVFLSEWRQVV